MSLAELETLFFTIDPYLWLGLSAFLGLLIGVQIGKRIGRRIGANQAMPAGDDMQDIDKQPQTLDEVIEQEQQVAKASLDRLADESNDAVDSTRNRGQKRAEQQAKKSVDDVSVASPQIIRVEQLVGIDEKHVIKLKAHNISSIDELIDATGSRKQREGLADALQLEDFIINKWSRMARFLKLPNMSSEAAEFLVFAGIHSTHDLAERKAESLFHKLQDLNQKEQRMDHVPSQAQFEQWIAHISEQNH